MLGRGITVSYVPFCWKYTLFCKNLYVRVFEFRLKIVPLYISRGHVYQYVMRASFAVSIVLTNNVYTVKVEYIMQQLFPAGSITRKDLS